MRSIWKGFISFGLVNIPVDLFPAEKDNELKFSLIDSRDDNKIKYLRVNEVTCEEVPWDRIVKAYCFDDGSYVVMTDEDFEKADLAATKTLGIEAFINKDELSLIYLEKPYYIAPDKGGEKPYVLLREAMIKSGLIAVAKIVLRSKGYLAAVYPLGQALVLNLIRYQEDLRSIDDLPIPENAKVSAKEMELAGTLIDSMTAKWAPEAYRDEYRDAVMRRIEKKAKKKVTEEEEGEVAYSLPSGKIVDIMDLLKKSVAAKKPQAEEETEKKAN